MMHRLFIERSFNIWQIWAKSVNQKADQLRLNGEDHSNFSCLADFGN